MALTAEVVEGFVATCLLPQFDQPAPIPDCHREWWKLACGKDPRVAIAAPRGFAKSTAITHSYALASLLFRDRSFCLIISGTEAQAIMFLNSIKLELTENETLIQLFGIKPPKEWMKESETDIIVTCTDGHRFRIVVKGAEQKLRGTKWGNKRPDLIICDDIEEDEAVMSKERREKFRKWFLGALMPCMSDSGIIRVVGTILHMDSLLERLMPEYQLLEKTRAVRLQHLKAEALKTYSTFPSGSWKSIKYRAHTDDFKELLWVEKCPKEYLLAKRKMYIEQGQPDVYAQEYLNVPLDESMAYFKKKDFRPEMEADKGKALKYYITGDLAISEKDRSDYTAFVVGGVDENGILHIKLVIRERMDSLTIMDTIFALQKLYDPELFGLEAGQISKSIGPFLYNEMPKRNIWPNLFELKPSADKLTRARSISARIKAGGVRFDKDSEWYQMLEDEMVRFPRDKHDDQVDCMAYLGLTLDKMVEAPTEKEIEEDFYDAELRESGIIDAGRSAYTGY